jgi:hypothetical protein
MAFVSGYVAIIPQALKIIIYTVVTDRPPFFVRFKVSFGYVGTMGGTIDQNMIPGAVFWWSGLGDIFIPVVTAVKFRVNVNNDAAIAKQSILDQLPDAEFSSLLAHRFCS